MKNHQSSKNSLWLNKCSFNRTLFENNFWKTILVLCKKTSLCTALVSVCISLKGWPWSAWPSSTIDNKVDSNDVNLSMFTIVSNMWHIACKKKKISNKKTILIINNPSTKMLGNWYLLLFLDCIPYFEIVNDWNWNWIE